MNIPARYCTGYLGDIGVPSVRRADGFQRLVRGLSRRPLAHLRRAPQHAPHRPHPDGARAATRPTSPSPRPSAPARWPASRSSPTRSRPQPAMGGWSGATHDDARAIADVPSGPGTMARRCRTTAAGQSDERRRRPRSPAQCGRRLADRAALRARVEFHPAGIRRARPACGGAAAPHRLGYRRGGAGAAAFGAARRAVVPGRLFAAADRPEPAAGGRRPAFRRSAS